MAVFKKGNNWYIDYYVQGRRKREKIGPNKRLAEKVLAKRKIAIAENRFLDIRREEKVRFKDFAQEYLEWAKINKRSWKKNDKLTVAYLEPLIGNLYLYEIDTHMVEKYKEQRIKETSRKGTPVSPATVNRELTCLKHMFNMAIKWGKTRTNPVVGVKFFREENRRIRYLTIEESRKLMEACTKRLQPVVIVALHTGMRMGEIFKLKWEDIDFDQGIIYVLNTKSGEAREIPMSKVLTETIRNVKFKGPYVFCRDGGKPYPQSTIRRLFKKAVAKIGLNDFRFHDLRHTFASQLVMAGIDLKTVQELLGHKTIEMTLRYAHLSPDHKRRAIEILERHFEGSGHRHGHQRSLAGRDVDITR